jgi:hypothetical protein
VTVGVGDPDTPLGVTEMGDPAGTGVPTAGTPGRLTEVIDEKALARVVRMFHAVPSYVFQLLIEASRPRV